MSFFKSMHCDLEARDLHEDMKLRIERLRHRHKQNVPGTRSSKVFSNDTKGIIPTGDDTNDAKNSVSAVAYDIICQQRVLKALRLKKKNARKAGGVDVKNFSRNIRLRNLAKLERQKKLLPPLILVENEQTQNDGEGWSVKNLLSPVATLKAIILSPVATLKKMIFSPVASAKKLILSPIAASRYLLSPLSQGQPKDSGEETYCGDYEVDQRVIPKRGGWRMKFARAIEK